MRVYVLNAKKKKIIDDDDNGTVWHRLSHLNTRYEPYNEQYITHRHRVYCCINYVLVFALFTIILLLASVYQYPCLYDDDGPHKIETGKTWSIFNLSSRNWAVCSLKFNLPYESTVRLYGSTQRQP